MRIVRVLLAIGVLAPMVAGPASAQANFSAECIVEGNAGTYQIKRIVVPDVPEDARPGIEMELWRADYPLVEADDYHIFGGVWLLNPANRLATHSFAFFDAPYHLGPSHVSISVGGEEAGALVPMTGLVTDGFHGAGHIVARLRPGTYFLVGFGDGGGRYRATLSLDYTYNDPGDIGCEEVHWPGRVVGYNASDFTGGTQLVVPGYGHMDGGVLEFSNPYSDMIGALFFYQPDPFPPASVCIITPESSGCSDQVIWRLYTYHPWWRMEGFFSGKTDTVLLSMLQLDQPCNLLNFPCPPDL